MSFGPDRMSCWVSASEVVVKSGGSSEWRHWSFLWKSSSWGALRGFRDPTGTPAPGIWFGCLPLEIFTTRPTPVKTQCLLEGFCISSGLETYWDRLEGAVFSVKKEVWANLSTPLPPWHNLGLTEEIWEQWNCLDSNLIICFLLFHFVSGWWSDRWNTLKRDSKKGNHCGMLEDLGKLCR